MKLVFIIYSVSDVIKSADDEFEVFASFSIQLFVERHETSADENNNNFLSGHSIPVCLHLASNSRALFNRKHLVIISARNAVRQHVVLRICGTCSKDGRTCQRTLTHADAVLLRSEERNQVVFNCDRHTHRRLRASGSHMTLKTKAQSNSKHGRKWRTCAEQQVSLGLERRCEARTSRDVAAVELQTLLQTRR